MAERQAHWGRFPSWWVEDLGLLRDAYGNPSIPDPWQETILDSTRKRKILNIHRQAGKSAIASLKCLHKAVFKPGSLSLIIAPALRQSRENFKSILKAVDLLPVKPTFREFTKLSLETDQGSRILCLPGGNEGATIRGFARPDLIVEDEAARCTDELHQAILPMMTANPECELLLASTPWGPRGHYYKTWAEGGENWLKIELNAEMNPRIDKTFLEEQKHGPNGPYYYAQEFMCQFVASEGSIFSSELFKSLANPSISPLKI